MSNKREQIIATTCHLMELQGYHATGLNQIVTESGAPKGSLYHYFPDGKDEIIEEAIAHTSRMIQERLHAGMAAAESPAKAIPDFLRNLAVQVQASGFQAGGPITAVALEAASTNERLNAACRAAYQAWQAIIEQKLVDTGCDPIRARRLGSIIISLIEGAIILSRTERNVGPLLDAAVELEALL
ncbi:MAG: TetR/AcrR family transcriptional regulator [Chloroflexota bacterium]|jgi:TetR/AcrR family transcriptional regulator, lmrAB and yxaGH operons repressor